MKFVVIFSILICVTLARPEGKYTTKYDNIDLDEIFKNERLLTAYYKCLKEGSPCTADGEELRKALPDAIKTDCQKCTDKQRNGAKRVAAFLIKEKSQWWEDLENLYDPAKTFAAKFRDQLKTEGLLDL